MRLIVDEAVSKSIRGLTIGTATFTGLSVEGSDVEFDKAEREVLKDIRKRYTLAGLKDDPIIGYYRDLLWSLKLDPTKMRPSSEALLRRVIRGEPLPRINNVVDACNLASVATFISMGSYDLDKISKSLKLRFAKEGEEFIGIDGLRKVLSGKELVIADEEKIIHVYPCKDSEETKVGLETENVLLVVCGAPGIPSEKVELATKKACEYIKRFAGGKEKIRIIKGLR